MATTRSIKLHYRYSLLSWFLPLYPLQGLAVPRSSQMWKAWVSWPQALDQIALSSCQRAEQGVAAKVQKHSTTAAANTQPSQQNPVPTCHKAGSQTSTSTLPLRVAPWLAAGLTRQSLSRTSWFAVHFTKTSSVHPPTPRLCHKPRHRK